MDDLNDCLHRGDRRSVFGMGRMSLLADSMYNVKKVHDVIVNFGCNL